METAVEWLENKFKEELVLIQSAEGHHIFIRIEKFCKLIEKAKEMEKEQMRIYSIDKELFKRLPIEGTNFCSFNVNEFRYFASKYYIDNFKESFNK